MLGSEPPNGKNGTEQGDGLEPIERLTKDLREASRILSDKEARFLVDAYYIQQESRKRADNQVRAMMESDEPHRVLGWYADQARVLENQIKRTLDAFSGSNPVGVWSRTIVGIGPVLAAGLLAHIDISICHYPSRIWRFAGLDPTQEWKKGQKRPWNAALKTLCWKIGESFVKTCNHEASFYGPLYQQRKAEEDRRNAAGEFNEQAKAILERKRIGKKTEAYKAYSQGYLPPAHIHSRAKRWTVKLFLSHWHEVAYWHHFQEAPPKPYAFEVMGHRDYIPPPNFSHVM